jgi:hypothetical protein
MINPEPTGPFGRVLARLLMAASKRRLSVSERIGDNRAVLWISDN